MRIGLDVLFVFFLMEVTTSGESPHILIGEDIFEKNPRSPRYYTRPTQTPISQFHIIKTQRCDLCS
ncbi:hypothetical protein, partial [Pasteurella multocida]|uniref:hypothetical protein n=1 Tax=Pasteurella multocida TaxID=747 RepID=UPI001B875E1D